MTNVVVQCRLRLLAMTLSVACFAFGGCTQKEDVPPMPVYKALNPQQDFTLTDQEDKVFHLKDHRGQAVLLFFGYLTCPDICPTTLSKLARVYSLLGKDYRQKVLTVFVSIDPQRDTPQKLKEYLGYFNINSVGLTGPKPQVDAVVKAYGATYEKVETQSAAGYLFNHSDYLYLIDTRGQVRHLFHPEDQAQEIAEKLRSILNL